MVQEKSYHKEFTHFEKIFQRNRKLSIKLFINEIQTIEERLGFQFSLHEAVVKIIEEDNITNRLIQKPISREAKLILGRQSKEIESILGYPGAAAVDRKPTHLWYETIAAKASSSVTV